MAADTLTLRPRLVWRVGFPVLAASILLPLRAVPHAALLVLVAVVAWTEKLSCDGNMLRRRSLIGRSDVALDSLVYIDVDRRPKVGRVLLIADADDAVELAHVWWAGLPSLLEHVLPQLYDGREWRSDLDIDAESSERLLDFARLRPRSAPP